MQDSGADLGLLAGGGEEVSVIVMGGGRHVVILTEGLILAGC